MSNLVFHSSFCLTLLEKNQYSDEKHSVIYRALIDSTFAIMHQSAPETNDLYKMWRNIIL